MFRLIWERRIENLSQINEENVIAFLASVGKRSNAKMLYARGIRSLVRFLVRRNVITDDLAEAFQVKRPKKPPTVALTEDELVRLLIAAAWRDPRRAWALMLTFGIGARRMEVEAIRPEDVQSDVVHLRHCKGGKERRVELSPIARVALEELRPWYNGTVLGGIRRQMITEWAHRAAEDAGLLEKVRHRPAHVLRASFITYLLQRGIAVQVVRDLVGHENIATTNDYAAVFSEDRRRAVEKLHL